MELRKEWFEPGPDCGHTVDAKDAEIAELRESLERTKLALNTTRQQRDNFWSQRDAARAEVERLKNECSDQQIYVLDLESAIARKDTRIKVLEIANDSLTQYSSNLTTERDALQEKYSRLEINSGEWLQQRDALQAQLLQVESFVRENNAPPARISKLINQRQELAILNSKYIEAKHQRDALQARIDAGVRVYSLDCKDWHTERCLSDNHSATLIIDQPDAAMVDERTGKADRREVGCDASLEARLAIGRDHTRVYVDDLDCNGTVKCARSNDRRRVAGTIADRKEAS